jgi:hypothetical protein
MGIAEARLLQKKSSVIGPLLILDTRPKAGKYLVHIN